MTLYSQQTDPDSHEGGQENAEYVEYFADPLPRISATTGHFQSTQFSQPLQDSLISLTSRSHHHSHQKRDRSSHPIHIPNFAIYPSFGMDCHPDLASPTESYCRQAPEVGSNAVDRNFLLSNRHPTNQTIPLQPISSYWTIPDCSIDNSFADLHSQEMNTTERGIAGFVSKLYQSLQAPDEGQKYAHWCNHNGVDMFIIECIPKFTENVLPKLFKHCKFASFVRQLNIYGFQRDTDARKSKDSKDKETCRWYHPYFRPGRRDLFYLIRRKTPRYSRRKRVKAAEDVETIINVESGDESGTEIDYGNHANEISGNEGSRRSPSSDRLSGTTLQPLDFESHKETTRLFRQGSCPELQDTRSLSASHSVPDTDINIADSMMLLQYGSAQTKPASLTYRELQLCKQVIYQKRTYEAMQHAFTTQMQETHSKLEAQQAQIDDLCAAIQSMDQSQEQIMKQNTICGTVNTTIGTTTAYGSQPAAEDCTMTTTATATTPTSLTNSHYPQSIKGYLPKSHLEDMKQESNIQARPSHITLTDTPSYDVFTPLSDFTPFQTMADPPFGAQSNVHFRSQASGPTSMPIKQSTLYQHQSSWPIPSTQCVVSNASRIATAAAMTAAATTSNISTKIELSMGPNRHTSCL